MALNPQTIKDLSEELAASFERMRILEVQLDEIDKAISTEEERLSSIRRILKLEGVVIPERVGVQSAQIRIDFGENTRSLRDMIMAAITRLGGKAAPQQVSQDLRSSGFDLKGKTPLEHRVRNEMSLMKARGLLENPEKGLYSIK